MPYIKYNESLCQQKAGWLYPITDNESTAVFAIFGLLLWILFLTLQGLAYCSTSQLTRTFGKAAQVWPDQCKKRMAYVFVVATSALLASCSSFYPMVHVNLRDIYCIGDCERARWLVHWLVLGVIGVIPLVGVLFSWVQLLVNLVQMRGNRRLMWLLPAVCPVPSWGSVVRLPSDAEHIELAATADSVHRIHQEVRGPTDRDTDELEVRDVAGSSESIHSTWSPLSGAVATRTSPDEDTTHEVAMVRPVVD